MKIGVYSQKGGVGKTTLSHSLAKDLDFNYITNDNSIVTTMYKKAKFTPNKIPLQENTVYDFGGFKHIHSDEVLENIDFLLIPTILDSNSIMKTVQVYKEFKHKKIIIIANMIESKKEAEKLSSLIKKYIPNVEIFFLRRSKLLKNALESGVSATELFYLDKRNEYVYRKSFKDYSKILKFLKNKV